MIYYSRESVALDVLRGKIERAKIKQKRRVGDKIKESKCFCTFEASIEIFKEFSQNSRF